MLYVLIIPVTSTTNSWLCQLLHSPHSWEPHFHWNLKLLYIFTLSDKKYHGYTYVFRLWWGNEGNSRNRCYQCYQERTKLRSERTVWSNGGHRHCSLLILLIIHAHIHRIHWIVHTKWMDFKLCTSVKSFTKQAYQNVVPCMGSNLGKGGRMWLNSVS